MRAALAALVLTTLAAGGARGETAVVARIVVDGAITPAVASFIGESLERARR